MATAVDFKQSLLQRDDLSVSLRFGYLGLGMGGCSIAASCADISTKVTNLKYPYTALLLNTNKMDLEKIDYRNPNIKKLTIGDGKGAGRNISIGETAYINDQELVETEIKKQFMTSDFVWIVAGLGGGTGTGTVIQAIKSLHSNGYKKRFGLILTLPRVQEGSTVLSNALERLQTISQVMKGMGSIIVVDNQKLYDYYTKEAPNATVSEYLSFSNRFVAETLHELNVVTSSFKPYGEYHFDSSEFENLIKTPGLLHLAKFSSKSSEIDSEQQISYLTKLEDYVNEGVLSDGYKLNSADRLAVSIIANKTTADRIFNIQFTNNIENAIDTISPSADEKPIAQYIDDRKDANYVQFYAMFAGLSLPKRVSELVQENERLIQLQEEHKNDSDDVLSALSTFKRKKNETHDDLDDLFSDSKAEDKLYNDTEYNPLDDL
ncbi:plasmid replication protein [Cytobacillus sp. IB215665]|uniref:plasmid replication protein n=1 Tax=Cytobacillus sp. IB215665 TaxID=3097357 RepID=UPI002A0D407B|nr:plasmid replication protein [Cytobacillus sp. IB215665]MDX8367930.1 plasmid replication protein [Cytobacillus sp. IB215665]